MASLGADNQPAMGDVEAEQLSQLYPGLENYAAKQSVLKIAMISAVAFEFALVELENEADAKAVADIFQARIDYQIENGAFYPIRCRRRRPGPAEGSCSAKCSSVFSCVPPRYFLPSVNRTVLLDGLPS